MLGVNRRGESFDVGFAERQVGPHGLLGHIGITTQDVFEQALVIEQRPAKRSGEPFEANKAEPELIFE